jgi:hypothetical protein
LAAEGPRSTALIAALTSRLTVGQVRAALAADESAQWRVRADLADAQPPPRFGRGGLRTAPRDRPLGRAEVDKLVAELPTNPLVARARAELDLLSEAALIRYAQLGQGTLETGRAPRAAAGREGVDWRERWGQHWITAPRAQGWCENGWAFATVALVEAMVRIEHRVWALLSEGDLRDGWAAERGEAHHGWLATWRASVADALRWAAANGIADADTRRLEFADSPYRLSPHRAGRTVRVGQVFAVAGVDAIKRWLDVVGPLVVGFEPHEDFGAYAGGVYRPTGVARPLGHHDVLLVGYDDRQSCWIVKNSWGAAWGEGGFARIGYGCCQLERWPALGVQRLDPGPWVRRRSHAGALLESADQDGQSGLLALRGGWRPVVLRREDADGDELWRASGYLGAINQVEAERATLGLPALAERVEGDGLHAVCWEFSGGLRFWSSRGGASPWRDQGRLGPPDAAGWPALTRTATGDGCGLDLVVRTARGRLAHWVRDASGWREAGRFAAGVRASGPALAYVGPHASTPSLDVVCVGDHGRLEHWRRARATEHWRLVAVFGRDVGQTPPCLIVSSLGQSDEFDHGPMELLVASRGRAQHWRRTGRHGGWRQVGAFGGWIRHVWGLAHSSVGNLEALVERLDGGLHHYVRDTYGWHYCGPVVG